MTGTTRTPGSEEFSRYVSERGPALLRMARSLTNSHADAEDLLQAALVKTFLAWGRIAERMGVTIGTVKSTLSRSVEKLRHDADLIIERTTT